MEVPRDTLRPVGRVRSSLSDPARAPKQGHEGAPDAWLVFDAEFGAALDGVQIGDRMIVLTWLDRASRNVLRVHPRDDPNNPERGVFSTRSADRPNPIGLHLVRIAAITGTEVLVHDLEAVDDTPILDLKPTIHDGADG